MADNDDDRFNLSWVQHTPHKVAFESTIHYEDYERPGREARAYRTYNLVVEYYSDGLPAKIGFQMSRALVSELLDQGLTILDNDNPRVLRKLP